MKVTMLKNAFKPEDTKTPSILMKGMTYELEDDAAKILIGKGAAEEIKEEKPKKKEEPKTVTPAA